jgi:competence protein ComEA
MDMNAPWRALEGPELGQAPPPPERPKPAGFLVLLAASIGLVVCSLGVVVFAGSQGGQVDVVSSGDSGAGPSVSPSRAMLLVDVTGAVAHPGVYSLPLGSRAADAIASAGGYSPDVDPRQVEAQLNLAAKLQDGESSGFRGGAKKQRGRRLTRQARPRGSST